MNCELQTNEQKIMLASSNNTENIKSIKAPSYKKAERFVLQKRSKINPVSF